MNIEHGSSRRAFLAAGAGAAIAASGGGIVRLARAQVGGAGRTPTRDAYSVDPNVTYLNHASLGTTPRVVQDAFITNYRTLESNPWLYMWGPAWKGAVEETHAAAAAFLGVGVNEVAITHDTTEAFNTLAWGLPLGPGDEALFSSLNHVGASRCFRHAAVERGYTVRSFEFPVKDAPGLSDDDVVDLYARQIRERTRVLILPHVDNVIGLRRPVARIAAAARERGVEFIAIDGAQAVGMFPVDIAALGVDFYATSAHKWLQSPKELGIFYVRAAMQGRLRPLWVTWGQDRWKGTARVYADYGTRNLPAVLALRDCFAFQRSLGRDRLETHLRAMRDRLRGLIQGSDRLAWRSPKTWAQGASLVMIGVPGRDPGAVFERMYHEHGFVFRAFAGGAAPGLRVSMHAMNSAGEIDRFVETLEREVAAT